MSRVTERFLLCTLALAVSMVPPAATHAQQRPGMPASGPVTQSEASTEPATGLILGRVIDGDTGAPISGAIVSTSIPSAVTIAMRGAGPGQLPPPPPPPRLVSTNGDGEFLFAQLPRGSYMLTSTAPGYSVGQSGQRRIGGPALPIALQQGQRIGDVTIRMWKYGVITGTVVDEYGEPSVNTQVRVMRVMYVGAQKRITAGGNYSSTDDRGVFRAAGLLPGDYVVQVPQSVQSLPASTIDRYQSAQAMSADGRIPDEAQGVLRAIQETGVMGPTSGTFIKIGDQAILGSLTSRATLLRQSDGRFAVYPTTYYNSTTSAADAQVITLTSGQERTGVDLQIHAVPAATVSGRVIGPDGPSANQGVRLMPMAAAQLGLDANNEQATTATDATGAFTFPAVPFGQYMLRASRIPQVAMTVRELVTVDGVQGASAFNPIAGRSAFDAREAWFAEQPIAVDHNVANLVITMSPGFHATGHFVFQGSAPPPAPEAIQRMQVSLVSAEGRPAPGLAPGTSVTPDGQFTSARYQPGHMFVNVVLGSSLGPYRLQTVMLGGRSHDVEPFDLTSGDLEGLTIVFTDAPSSLEIAVPASAVPTSGSDTAASADADSMLFVIPANYIAWLNGGMAPRVSATVGMSGSRVTVPNLPPGDYIAIVVSSAAAAAAHDTAFYQSLARVGVRVSLAAGEHRSIEVPIADIR